MPCACCCKTYTLTCDGVETTYSFACDQACFIPSYIQEYELALRATYDYEADPQEFFNGPFSEADLEQLACFLQSRGLIAFQVIQNIENAVDASFYCCEYDEEDLEEVYLEDCGAFIRSAKCINNGCEDCGAPPP